MPPKIRKVAKDKKTGIPKKYVPKSLSKEDKEKQVKSIKEKKDRPKLKSAKTKRSSFVVAFEKKYKTKITDKAFINKNILKNKGQEEILKKGRGAYYSQGSRPNTTPSSWALARLASVIMNGKARQVDIDIWNKYKV
mgnify:CR=1 FL=1